VQRSFCCWLHSILWRHACCNAILSACFKKFSTQTIRPIEALYSVRGSEWSGLGGSHGCPGRLWDRFLNRSTRTIVGTMLWMDYRPVIKIGPKGALGSHEIRPIHSAPSLGQSIHSKTALTFSHYFLCLIINSNQWYKIYQPLSCPKFCNVLLVLLQPCLPETGKLWLRFLQ